jgi:hypothetical protein
VNSPVLLRERPYPWILYCKNILKRHYFTGQRTSDDMGRSSGVCLCWSMWVWWVCVSRVGIWSPRSVEVGTGKKLLDSDGNRDTNTTEESDVRVLYLFVFDLTHQHTWVFHPPLLTRTTRSVRQYYSVASGQDWTPHNTYKSGRITDFTGKTLETNSVEKKRRTFSNERFFLPSRWHTQYVQEEYGIIVWSHDEHVISVLA